MAFDIGTQRLTLRKINNSQNEMAYITRMRNAISFQIASSEDYKYFKKHFNHLILLKIEEITELLICVDHALTKIVKSHVLLHNSEHLLQWKTITIDKEGFSQNRNEDQRIAEISKRIAENESVDLFLVTNFKKRFNCTLPERWPTLQSGERPIFADDILSAFRLTCIADHHYLPLESTWSRVYYNNGYFFLFEKVYVAAYLDDQIQKNRSASVFKQIVNRERSEKTFNQFEILKAIASPYYFVLPYQDGQKLAQIRREAHGIHERLRQGYVLFFFQSRLDVAMKILL
ncbi:uncharacterized protein NPIL_439931 [Nephila pilipes]|uniref:Uncharacterized protein n=1 Tax=Nephila pilipes TaxID=299642 RepID=A0A8X6NGA4_NEPPI|nr:uncharacterized protein NPIL_439931 [Nephila pilipes]